MTVGGFGLTFVGVVAWLFVLASTGPRRSVFRVLVEALAVHAVVSTIVAVGLVSGAAFRVTAAQALAATVPLVALLRSRRLPWPRLRRVPPITRLELIALLALVLVAPVALPRMALLYMENDAGVYSNRAIHHLDEGSLVGTIPVRGQLEGELLDRFDRDNVYSQRLYRPGAYRVSSDPGQFIFQFFPGWPMLMAQWAGLFGLSRMFYAGLFAFSTAVLLFGFLLQSAGLRGASFTLAVVLFASSPLLLYFSKYPTTEAFLLFLLLFVMYFLGQGGVCHTILAAAGFLAIVLTHVSTFVYAPLVLLVALEAYRSASRSLAGFSAVAFGALLVGLPLGLVFSPIYVRDIYGAVFGRLGVEDPARVGLLLVAAFYAAGLAVSLAAVRRASHTQSGGAPAERWLSSGGAALRVGIRVAWLVVAAGIVYRAYQLGWTDHFASLRTSGAWGARLDYSGGGWAALTHLSIVSLVLATSLVGLPLTAVLAFRRGDRVCATPRRCFLLACVLLSLGIFTFIRPDVPFNYYPSRYFIPVFVPATMLLFGYLVEAFQIHRRWILILALVGLGFNLRYDLALYRYPPSTDEMRFVEDLAARVGDHRVLFARNLWRSNRMIRRLVAGPLAHAHGIWTINVVGRPEMPAHEAMEQYARQLRVRDAAVLSKDPPTDGRAFETVSLARRKLARARFYPHSGVERVHRFYLYNVSFEWADGGPPPLRRREGQGARLRASPRAAPGG